MEKNNYIFGTRAIIEAFRAEQDVEKLYVQSGISNSLLNELLSLAREHHVQPSYVPLQKLNKLSNKNHQGVVALVSVVRYASLEQIIDEVFTQGRDPFLLLLDKITDVRNFGAIARSAESAGVNAIIISSKGNAPITSDAIKTSAGALHYIPICKTAHMKTTIQSLKESGIIIVACSEKSKQSIYEVSLSGPLAVLVGSEESGISEPLLEMADYHAAIPMNGKIKSLNVSVATGIALYEAVRQRG